MKKHITISVLGLAFATHFIYAEDFSDAPPPAEIDKTEYSPYPEQNYPNRAFFGDPHLHTSYSTDARMVGFTLGPEDAYRLEEEK